MYLPLSVQLVSWNETMAVVGRLRFVNVVRTIPKWSSPG